MVKKDQTLKQNKSIMGTCHAETSECTHSYHTPHLFRIGATMDLIQGGDEGDYDDGDESYYMIAQEGEPKKPQPEPLPEK